MTRKLTTRNLIEMKAANTKIVSLTAYDASFARVLDNENVDVILVGDSLGMVIQGAANTLAVSMRDMIYHSAIVSGVVERGLVVVDMPFMSYQADDADLTLTVNRADLETVMAGTATFEALLADGRATHEGDIGILGQLAGPHSVGAK